MYTLEKYVKEKTNKLVDAFFKLCEIRETTKGKSVRRVAKIHCVDIDEDYKLELDWADGWSIIYKESKAEVIKVREHPWNALPLLIGKFTENVIEDYDYKCMNMML